jgi:AraC family transcriptional regulator
MHASGSAEFDQIVFDSGLVRVGSFRCHPSHPSFHDTGPARNFCFVFPRTAVEIEHEHERAFVANPNVVTFYNKGQAYVRNPISAEGDRCDWFGMDIDIVRDVVKAFDPSVEYRPDTPFRFTHGWSDARTYLLQRRLLERLAAGDVDESLTVEESVVSLLESVIRSAYCVPSPAPRSMDPKQHDIVRHTEKVLSTHLDERLSLRRVASEVGISAYHLCRIFHRATGTTLHDYRQKVRLRWSLENVAGSDRRLVDIALDAGFSSHSHYTSTFRREFAQTPSSVRARAGKR